MNQQTDGVRLREENDEVEIDLVELLYFYKSRWILILTGIIVGAVLAGAITYFCITPKYTAMSKMYMVSASKDSVIDITDLNLGTSLSSDYEELLKIRPIFETVIEENKLPYKYEELLDMVTVSTITDTRILTISVESTDPNEAQLIANALAKEAKNSIPELMDTSEPNIAELAIVPEEKSSPSYATNIMIGAVGVMVVILAALTVMYVTDDTLKSAEDVEKAFGIMPLTVIPEGDIGGLSEKEEKKQRGRKKEK